jgi:hypothetical protein
VVIIGIRALSHAACIQRAGARCGAGGARRRSLSVAGCAHGHREEKEEQPPADEWDPLVSEGKRKMEKGGAGWA